MFERAALSLSLTLPLLAGAQMNLIPTPPLAPQVPHTIASPQGDRDDPYFWLRDDDASAKRPEVMQYLDAENTYTAAVMAPLAGLQAQLVAEMRGRIQPDDSTPPVYDGGWWLWRTFRAGAEYPLLMRQRGSPEKPDPRAPQQVLLDQPAMAAGKAYFRVGAAAVSPDGRTLAWTEDTVGRRMYTLRFKDIATGAVLPDAVPGVLEGIVWAGDSRTLFYVLQDPVTLQSGPVWRHTLAGGDNKGQDAEVYQEADKTLFVDIERSASRKYIVITARGTQTAETLAVPADAPTTAPRIVLARKPQVRHRADHIRGRWYVRTNEDALNFRLISAPEAAPDVRSLWRTVVPARDEATLEKFALLDRGIALQERVAADSRVRLLLNGAGVPVPAAPGSSVTLGDNRDPAAAYVRYDVTSLVQPLATHDLHLATRRSLLRKLQPVPGFDASLYATDRLWAPARDGRRVPVTLAWRRDRARPDGTSPLLVIGYGSYGYSSNPSFSASRVSLLDRGFVVAIAHVRGGAELGEGWYADGRMMNKKNTFNDFIDATNALLQAGWGAPDRVFASGGSAGGLLMGVVANQSGATGGRSYKGIVLQVPFVDVVTTMLDESIPLTTNEWSQWGDPREKAAYDYMLSYSPYDNLKRQPYPAMLVTTGLWDSQVQYYEPAKYVARLRTLKTDGNPLLLHVNMAAGHGGASGRFEILNELARQYAFFIDLAGVR